MKNATTKVRSDFALLPPPSSGGGSGWGSADSPLRLPLRPATPSPSPPPFWGREKVRLTHGRSRRRQSLAAQRVRLRVVPRRPGGDHRDHSRRPRRARDHADRQRQVAVLPAPGAVMRRAHHRGLAAHRADAQPGRAIAQLRHRRRRAQLLERLQREPRHRRADRARRIAARLHRAGTARQAGNHRDAQDREGRPAGGRRGPLHFPVGSRFSPGIHEPGRASRRARRAADGRVHRDRRCRDPHRYSRAAVPGAAGGVRPRLRPAQSAPRHEPARRRPRPAPAVRGRASRRQRHRLLQLAQGDRGARGILSRRRRQGAALSRRDGARRTARATRTYSCRRTAW